MRARAAFLLLLLLPSPDGGGLSLGLGGKATSSSSSGQEKCAVSPFSICLRRPLNLRLSNVERDSTIKEQQRFPKSNR